ncbi:MAG: hypothetical protein WD988_04205 [Candidatus Curtissbacteria bacterium]
MPEKKIEIINTAGWGEVSTPVTDESLQRSIDLLRQEISGMSKSQVLVETEVREDIFVGKTNLAENDLVRQVSGPEIVFTPESPMHIFEVRAQIRIARELGDEAAMRELRLAA